MYKYPLNANYTVWLQTPRQLVRILRDFIFSINLFFPATTTTKEHLAYRDVQSDIQRNNKKGMPISGSFSGI